MNDPEDSARPSRPGRYSEAAGDAGVFSSPAGDSELAGGMEASGRQCEVLLSTALESCERYFPAFQYVVWAGKPAREALDAAMFETAGRA